MTSTRYLPAVLAGAIAAAIPASGLGAGLQLLLPSDIEAMRSQRGASFTTEDFEQSMARFLPDMEFAACTEPVSSRSDDACFAPGGLAPGFSVRSGSGFGVLSLGRGLVGFASMTLGGWPYRLNPTSINSTRVEFDDGPTVVAADVFGFRIVNGNASGEVAPVRIEAFDLSGASLGSYVVTPPAFNQPAFAGFSSPEPIGAVEFAPQEEAVGVQIDNLLFGGTAQPPLLSDSRLAFGAQPIGSVEVLPVQVRNPGDQPWQVTAPVLQGNGFTLAEEDCSSSSLAPRSACTIWLAFEPGWVDTFFGRLQVTGDFGGAPLQVDLHGIGTQEASQ
jgi:hypothetical protein